MIEIWKDIEGYGGKYQVSNCGNIRHIYPCGFIKNMKCHIHKKSHDVIVKLTINGKPTRHKVMRLVAIAFLPPCPPNHVYYHKNFCKLDNFVGNIGCISKSDLGRMTGASAMRNPVAKINSNCEIVDVYTSAEACAKENYMSYQTIIDRCNGRCKSAFAPDGYAYAWDDEEVSMKHAMVKIKKGSG